MVEIFDDAFLAAELRFRGGTALNKLHFPEPLRYSEDIDLVRTSAGAIGPILDRLRELLEPWLGPANFAPSQIAPKFRFGVPAEGGGKTPSASSLRLTRTNSSPTTPSFLPHSPSKILGSRCVDDTDVLERGDAGDETPRTPAKG